MRPFSVISLLFSPLLIAAEKITYDDHIFPILEANCLNCHNPDKKKGGLDLSTYQGAMAGGSGGKITTAGDGAGSKLFSVTIHTEEPVMPPEGDKIKKKEADLIRAWIDGGLLESKSSRAKKPRKPAFSLSPIADPQAKPDGPPPMPSALLLDPVIVASRTTVINDMEASPWAPLLAITGQKQVLLYHTETLALLGILPFPHGTPESITFHPNGKHLVGGGGIGGKTGTSMMWDVTTGQVLLEIGREFDSVLAADIHPDLGTLALGGPSRILKIWNTRKPEERHRVKKHTDWITALCYSPDGKFLATGDRNNGIQIWESKTANEFHTLDGHKQAIVDLKWRSDSKALASVSADAQLILWDTKQGKQIKKIQAHAGGVLAMDYSRQGLFITSGRDRKVKFWKSNLAFQKELPVFESLVTEVEFSHDGKRFFTADWHGNILAWSIKGFSKIGTLDSNPPKISHRLVGYKKEIKQLSQTIAQKKTALTNQEKHLTQARAHLAKVKKSLTAERKKTSSLKKKYDVGQTALNNNEIALQETKTKLSTLTNETALNRKHIKSLEDKRKTLTDEALIAENNKNIKVAHNALAQRDLKLQELVCSKSDILTQRKEIRRGLDQTNAEMQQSKQRTAELEKTIKPATESLHAKKKKLAALKDEFGNLNTRSAAVQRSLKEWQAADANTRVLRAKQALQDFETEKLELDYQLEEATKAQNAETLISITRAFENLAVARQQAALKFAKLEKAYKALKVQ